MKELIFHSHRHFTVKATVVVIVDDTPYGLNRFRFGLSIASPKDNFTKKIGVKLARERAELLPIIDFSVGKNLVGITEWSLASAIVDDLFCELAVNKKVLNRHKRLIQSLKTLIN